MKVALVPFGDVPRRVLADLADDLAAYGIAAEAHAAVALPREAWDAKRRQYRGEALLAAIPVEGEDHILAVTAEDMHAHGLNFVFGIADLRGPRALVSAARLGSRDPRLFRERLLKEGVHELGHGLGLPHCTTPGCVMNFADSLAEADAKGRGFCARCRALAPLPLPRIPPDGPPPQSIW